MTIQEALQSGKNFRLHGLMATYINTDELMEYSLSARDILSNEWEIQPDPVITLTVGEFKAIWDSVRTQFTSVKSSNDSDLCKKLIESLTARD